jgi:hypothetical protein
VPEDEIPVTKAMRFSWTDFSEDNHEPAEVEAYEIDIIASQSTSQAKETLTSVKNIAIGRTQEI